ncbi:MAG: hypothetical protein PVH68_20705, partial [Armatimonadota bacterium]
MRASCGMASSILLIALSATRTPAWAGDQSASDAAVVTLGQWQSRTLQREDMRGKTQRSRDAGFDMGTIPYTIKYTAAVDEADPSKAIPVEGYIGMPRPTSANWYHSGFLFVIVNGQDIGTAALSSMMATETGGRAMLDLVWRHQV